MSVTKQENTPEFRKSPHSLKNLLLRQTWSVVYIFLFRPSPRVLHGWRRNLLRLFGAKVGKEVKIFPSVRVWAPWNLELGDNSSLGDSVNCYCVTNVSVGAYTTISQGSTLCAATHDSTQLHLPLITREISIGRHAWICAETFVMPGVSIGDGALIGVRSTVFSDIPPWQTAFGSPCKVVRQRELADEQQVFIDVQKGKINE